MGERLRQPKNPGSANEESLATLGYIIESGQDTAARAKDFMNQIADEIADSEKRLEELRQLGTEGAQKEIPIVENMLAQLREHLEDARSRHAQGEEDVALHVETRRHFIENLHKDQA